jgi:hypothetical protein
LICEELTEYSPQAAPLIETETPLNSIGNDGARFDSEAFALATVALVTAPKLPWAAANSPAAKPAGVALGLTEGLTEGLGDGLGLGVGLTLGLGVAVGLATGTVIKLAPVNREIPAVDSAVTAGDN